MRVNGSPDMHRSASTCVWTFENRFPLSAPQRSQRFAAFQSWWKTGTSTLQVVSQTVQE